MKAPLLFGALLCAGTCTVAQDPQLSLGVAGTVPIGYIASWFAPGGGLTIGYENPVGDVVSLDMAASPMYLGVASANDHMLRSAAILPLTVGIKVNPGRHPQRGLYGRAHLGYYMLWADGEPDQAFDIETGLTGGLTYHFGWGAGVGYQLRNFDFALHNNMVIPKGGVKGVPMQHFIMLRAAYLINLD